MQRISGSNGRIKCQQNEEQRASNVARKATGLINVPRMHQQSLIKNKVLQSIMYVSYQCQSFLALFVTNNNSTAF